MKNQAVRQPDPERIANQTIAHRIRVILEGRKADPEAIKYYIEDASDTDFEGYDAPMFSVEWALKVWEDFQIYVEECMKAEAEYADYKLLLYAIG